MNPHRPDTDQAGMMTIWMLGLATITLLLVALIVDGARIMNAVSDTGATARSAARAAALAVDPTSHTLTPAAETEAVTVIDARDMTAGPIVVTDDTVTVTVTTTIRLPLLTLLGVRERTVTSTATAAILQGVTAP